MSHGLAWSRSGLINKEHYVDINDTAEGSPKRESEAPA